MPGPKQHVHGTHGERLTHATRIRMVQVDRRDGTRPFYVEGHRLLTVRRLAAGT